VGDRRWGEGTAGEGFRRRPAAVAAAARGKAVRKHDAGQQVSWGGVLGPKEATGATGRRRARAESSGSVRRRQWRGGAREGAWRGARGGV
jgi:hypothetical protein